MNIKRLKIKGLRGFSKSETIDFAIPDGEHNGSGMTVFVGPNNGGKSTIIEAINYFTKTNNIKGIPSSARFNSGRVNMNLEYGDSNYEIYSDADGGSSIFFREDGKDIESFSNKLDDIFILSSYRYISDNFSVGYSLSRKDYGNNNFNYREKSNNRSDFGGRLRAAQKAKSVFNECLFKVISPLPLWYLESDDSNNQFLEFDNAGVKSRSSGSGDGIVNIFNIVDSLYDSSINTPILIDEPEKSLHPSLQRKLLKLLLEYSKDRQVIITTHSPYFVDWKNIVNNGMIVKRVCNKDNKIEIHSISDNTKNNMKNIVNNYQSPHAGGLNSIESFFLDDNIIVVEGQEDVVGYTNLFNTFKYNTTASFYGWGSCGYKNIGTVLSLLKDLGYKKVFVICDGNVSNDIKDVMKKYSGYSYISIPTDDIRDKKDANKDIIKVCNIINEVDYLEDEQKNKLIKQIEKQKYKTFLLDDVNNGIVKKEYEKFVIHMIGVIKKYFNENDEKIVISLEEQEELRKNRAKELVRNQEFNNPISKKILNEKKDDEDYGDTGDYETIKKINDDIYLVSLRICQECGDKSIDYILDYNVNIKLEDVKLINIKIINNTFNFSFDCDLIENTVYN